MRATAEPIAMVTVGTHEELLDRIRREGAYGTREQAEDALHIVLSGLARQLPEPERHDLAVRLPSRAGSLLVSQPSAPRTSTGADFVKDIASRNGTTPDIARWDAGSVLTVLAAIAGPELTARILRRLPYGWALLFGHAELSRAS